MAPSIPASPAPMVWGGRTHTRDGGTPLLRLMSVNDLIPGMRLAKNIYAADGRVLLSVGTAINERYLRRLRELHISTMWVEDGVSAGITVDDVVHDETRTEAVNVTREAMQAVTTVKGLRDDLLGRVSQVVDDILDDLLRNRDAVYSLTDIRALHDYTFGHSVSVAILAVLTGITLGYNELRLKRLGVGALLHDVGKAALPETVLYAPRKLTDEEFALVKQHPKIGFDVLRKADGIQPTSAIIALEHHERLDGSGYPQSLRGDKMHEFSRLVAVCDVFDAMTSDRPYRPRMFPSAALEHLRAEAGRLYDPAMVEAFVQNVAAFPPGTVVRLSSGAVGLVVVARRRAPTRPIVRLLTDPSGHRLPFPEDVDLMNVPDWFVAAPITREDVAMATSAPAS